MTAFNFTKPFAKPTLALLAVTLMGSGAAIAQSAGGDTVAWTATTPSQAVKPGGRVTVTLHGAVVSGWHVYGLKQLPEGPTPLSVAVETNPVATAAGAASGSAPEKVVDPGFGVETQFYSRDFTVTVPVKVGAHLAGGAQTIPVSVRFQTCNGSICKPPKTVRLSAPVNVRAG